MKHILTDTKKYLLRFDKGDDLVNLLISFSQEKHITAGYLSAIGTSEKLILSYYDSQKKEYIDKNFDEDLEIVSLTGNIAILDNKPLLHFHGVFSNREYKCVGGHVKKLIIGATCEVFLLSLDLEMKRVYDEETGLKLLVEDSIIS